MKLFNTCSTSTMTTMTPLFNEPRYKCPECGWHGTEREMEADYAIIDEDGEEVWSNWICPECKMWHNGTEDYVKVS